MGGGHVMKIRVLGCYGAQMPGFNTTGFLVDDTMLVDAGTVTKVLSLEEQLAINNVLITHGHLDHVQDLLFLADNLSIANSRTKPVCVISTEDILNDLRTHLFNDVIWPDFSVIPSPEKPVITFKAITPGVPFVLNDLRGTAVSVSHAVNAVSYILEKDGSMVLFISDTGPTEDVWKEANRIGTSLKALFVEVSFPNSMSAMALAAGHLTPEHLKQELSKLDVDDIPIFIYHIKPQYREAITEEIGRIQRKNLRIISDGDILQV